MSLEPVERSLSFNIEEIRAHQQNKYPLLFVDKIIQAVPGKYSIGIKNFTYNEWFFPAHFEDEANVPGFIQIECLVQVFLMSFLTMDGLKGEKTSFVSANNVRFRRKIVPGDQLVVTANLQSFGRGLAKGSVTGKVGEELAVSADFIVAVPSEIEKFKP